ncbi:UNVERIFIED_CONTAM: hypothetical protein K2H54_043735 [Gekko kuhli]
MGNIVVLLILLSIAQGSFSSLQVTQSSPAMVKPGGSIKVTCNVSRGRVSDYYWNWNRQLSGKGLEWLVFIRSADRGGTTQYSPAFSSRISIIRDDSRNEVYLHLSSLTAADTAVYYCVGGTER